MGLALGALGLSLGTPAQTRADELAGPAYTGNTIPVAHHGRGGAYWGGRSFYPGYNYGYYGGYYPYGGYRNYTPYRGNYYSPRLYGRGYYPYGRGYGYSPYNYNYNYFAPGYFW
ncbi:MAG TPA: hypothetical protein VMG10_16725 [Gemmataceae bacterium]|nr:hypothetical protein [Gemmataceae bacterium]